MFDPDLENIFEYPELSETANACYQVISKTVEDHLGLMSTPSTKFPIGTTAAWAIVHGLASLMVDSKISAIQPGEAGQRDLVEKATTVLVNGFGDPG